MTIPTETIRATGTAPLYRLPAGRVGQFVAGGHEGTPSAREARARSARR